MQEELALRQLGDRAVEVGHVDGPGGRGHALEQAGLVTLGLESTDEPGPGVRHGLVVQVDRVLRGEHHAHAEGTGLFQNGEDRLLRRRLGGGWHVPGDLVQVHQRPQLVRSRLGSEPPDERTQDPAHRQLALRVGQVREAHHRQAGTAVRRPEQLGHVQWGAGAPGLEPGGGEEPVERHGQRRALLRGDDGVEFHHAEGAHGRRLHPGHQGRQVQRLARGPRRVDQVGHEQVLGAGERVAGDADQAEQAGGDGLDLGGERLGVSTLRAARSGQGAHDVEGCRRRGARRVDPHGDGGAQGGDLLRAQVPLGQAVTPLGGDLGGIRSLRDPRGEVLGGEPGEGEQQVGQVALGVDGEHRDAGGERLLDQCHGQPGLAGSGHPDDDAVGAQVARVQGDGLAVAGAVLAESLTDPQSAPFRHAREDGTGA